MNDSIPKRKLSGFRVFGFTLLTAVGVTTLFMLIFAPFDTEGGIGYAVPPVFFLALVFSYGHFQRKG